MELKMKHVVAATVVLPALFALGCAKSASDSPATGGTAMTGGTSATGGVTISGGVHSGGTQNTGGTGGTVNTGGTSNTGGKSTTGGTPNTGGTAGAGGQNTGGTRTGGTAGGTGGTATGGTATGGTATGGSGGAGGGAGGSGATGAWLKCSQVTAQKLNDEFTAWKKENVEECSATKARVKKDKSNTTVSEGMGYGLLIAAGIGDCDLVKRLYKYYLDAQSYTNSPANNNLKGSGLMPWVMNAGCDTTQAGDANFATDGDLDAAMGLLQADAVCADRATAGYKTAAVTIINAIKKNAFLESNGKTILRGGGVGNSINPSYFAPGYFRAFAKANPENAAHWQKATTDAYSLLASYQSDMAGLFPDWGTADGKQAGGFYYDACRVPWRVATDYAWTQAPEAKKILDTFRTQGLQKKLPYDFQASQNKDRNSAFIGAMALSAVSADQETMNAFCTDWLSRDLGYGTGLLDDSPYFQGTLRVVYMLLAGGAFQSTL
jgi:endo-1,4-beta-D-glucanase Y